VKQAADANLVTSLSMVLPFGPAEKQALLEASDSTARAKLLVALLEMNAFGSPEDTFGSADGTPPRRAN
jgi:Lon protease-like protein